MSSTYLPDAILFSEQDSGGDCVSQLCQPVLPGGGETIGQHVAD